MPEALFKLQLLHWVKASESAQELFNSGMSIPYSTMAPGCVPCWFSKPKIWGVHLQSRSQGLGCLMWVKPLSTWKSSIFVRPLSVVGHPAGCGIFGKTIISAPSAHLDVALLSFVVE